ncbi:MAG: ABC transporter permease [Armatimonadota bacterium]
MNFAALLRRREVSLVIALVVVACAATAREPRFATPENIRSILLWMPLLVVAAMGQMAVILTRGIDVSTGSTMGLAGMATAMLLRDHPEVPVLAAAVYGTGVGGVLGAVNGALVARARIPPIVATLGTLGVYRGLTFWISQGRQVDEYQLPKALSEWSLTGPGGQPWVPWVVFAAAGVAFAMHWFLTWTRTGRDVYALGGNPDAAALRGIPTARITFLAYVLSGAAAGLAGVLYTSRFGNVNPAQIGSGFELQVIAAAVIGGVSVFGGVGGAPGVTLSALLLGTVNVALTVLAIAGTWQTAVYGLVLLVAVLADERFARNVRRKAGEAT